MKKQETLHTGPDGFLTSDTVTVGIRLGRFARGHHIGRAAGASTFLSMFGCVNSAKTRNEVR